MRDKILLIITIINTIIYLPFIGILKDISVPLHYGINGKPDLFGNKWGLMFFPLFALILAVLFYIYRKRYRNTLNQKIEDKVSYTITAFFIGLGWMMHLEAITGGNSLGKVIIYYAIFGVGLLFVYISYLMKHLKRNRFIGIRTRYTLKDDVVWNKTHVLASRLGIIGGTIVIISGIISIIFANLYMQILVVGTVIAIILSVFFPVVYSKKIFKK